jgi:hypothetical protein
MSYYAYTNQKHEFQNLLNESFGDNATEVYFDDFDKIPRVVASRICGKNPRNCTVIMAVKGTSNKMEVMTDLGIFSTVSVMQMLDKFAPLLGTVPKTVVAAVIDWFRLPAMQKTQQKYVQNLSQTLDYLQGKYSNDSLVITGHSLGGNFAELAGAKKAVPAVGFSAPGQFYMMQTFELGKQDIAENVMTIVPSMDAVPFVAKHVDTMQRILCRRKNGHFRNSLQCHSIEATGCELWRVCGDILKRNFAKKCLDKPPKTSTFSEALVNESCVGQVFSMEQNAPCKMPSDR